MRIFETVFGYQNLGKDVSLDHLVSQGFSREEAKMLAWIRNRIDFGKYAGLAGGVLAVLAIRKGHTLPLPFVSKPISSRLIAGVVLSSILCGDFLFNWNRRGGNAPVANLYSNNNLIANKLDLVQNYEPFNRKFTKDEIEQMLFNYKLKTYGRKKYIYNPAVHGDDEEAFKRKHELFNSGKHVITKDIQQDIDTQNIEKVKNKEVIVLKPFKITEHLDIHGSKEHIQKFELFTKRHVL